MRQFLFSLAFDKVDLLMERPMPRWYNFSLLAARHKIVSLKLSRCVSWPKAMQRNCFQHVKSLVLKSPLYLLTQLLKSLCEIKDINWLKTYLPWFISRKSAKSGQIVWAHKTLQILYRQRFQRTNIFNIETLVISYKLLVISAKDQHLITHHSFLIF